MTIQPCRLRYHYVPSSDIWVRYPDGSSKQLPSNQIFALIDKGAVEGKASRSGKLLCLVMLKEPRRMSEVFPVAQPETYKQKPGSVLSTASQTVVRQKEISYLCWAHMHNLRLDGKGFAI